MRKLTTVIALSTAITLFCAVPTMAQQKLTGDGGAAVATVTGVVVGGAIAYYFYPVSVATVALGAVAGGAIGAWWYNSADSGDSYAPLPRKSNVDDSAKPYR